MILLRERASFDRQELNGRKMASNPNFNPSSDIAASRSLPLGTTAKVKKLENDRQTTVKVEDRGPYVPGRILGVARKQPTISACASRVSRRSLCLSPMKA